MIDPHDLLIWLIEPNEQRFNEAVTRIHIHRPGAIVNRVDDELQGMGKANIHGGKVWIRADVNRLVDLTMVGVKKIQEQQRDMIGDIANDVAVIARKLSEMEKRQSWWLGQGYKFTVWLVIALGGAVMALLGVIWRMLREGKAGTIAALAVLWRR